MTFSAFVLLSGCAASGKKQTDVSTATPAAVGGDEGSGRIDNISLTDFVIGVGDTVEIGVYRHEDLDVSVKMDFSGIITYPLIGDIQVAGRSVSEFRKALKERLSEYIVDPQVSVRVAGVQSQKVIVLGEVSSPGIFPYDQNLSIIDIIAKAGGVTDDAKTEKIVLIRRGHDKLVTESYNMKEALGKGNVSAGEWVRNGDILYVPSTTLARVSGFMSKIAMILSPIVNLESGIVLWPDVKDVLSGKEGGGDSTVIISTD
jgi:polysaccharide export outer membrane protein